MAEKKIKVIRAKEMGFCMGVRRAIKIVDDLILLGKQKPIFSLGPLIHNKQVIEDYKKKGVSIISNPEDIEKEKNIEGTIIIRAHGIPPEIKKNLDKPKITLIDATCPRVLRSQKIVKIKNNEGYFIVIVGDKNHGEVIGIAGFAERCRIIQNEDQAANIELPEKTLVISQTTVKSSEFKKIYERLRKKNPHVEICDTICPATEKRQKALIELIAIVEAVVIIGGKNSANTKRLYITAKEKGIPAWHIESAFEIPEEIYNYSIVGVSAGASTPDWVIDKVENKILQR